jgi:hypothetical protein
MNATKFLLVSVALVASAMCQSTLKVKGHYIGESGDDFLRLEASTQSVLNDCHSNPPRQVSVEEVKRRKFPDGTTKRDMVEMAKQGRVYDRNVEDYKAKCDPLINVFDNGTKGDVMTEYEIPNSVSHNSATWNFEGGKVVGLQMIVLGDFAELRDDLTAKVGVKPQEIAIPYHNGFGATWNNLHAEWTTRDLHVSLLQNNNPVSGDVRPFLSVETRAKYDAEEKARAAQGSPLD